MAIALISMDPELEDVLNVRDLKLRFEYFKPERPGENCRIHGEQPEIEKFIWRYVTDPEKIKRGEWETPETANASDTEDFEHFLDIVES